MANGLIEKLLRTISMNYVENKISDIRSGYFGGRCEIYGFGKFDKVYYYDVTTEYPFVGSKYPMPIGNPER